MKKDFDKWNILKKKIDMSYFKPPIVKEGDIWWIYNGLNIGNEIDGKGEVFTRPAIILKVINEISFLIAPLTTSENYNDIWHLKIKHGKRESSVSFNQIKIIDYKRLKIKMDDQVEPDSLNFIFEKFESLYTNKRTSPLAGAGHKDSRLDDTSIVANHDLLSSKDK